MTDNYKDEYLLRLQKSIIFKTLVEKTNDKDKEVQILVDHAVSYAFQRTKTIVKHMGEYTLHDGDHLFRVLNLMERLLGENVIKNMSAPELMLLILTAFFHDIGMAPDEREVIAWKKVWDNYPEIDGTEETVDYEAFKRFYDSRPEQQIIIQRFISQGKTNQAETIKGYLISEYIRQTHANRARDIIAKDWDGRILFRDCDLTVELAQLCLSHNEDALKLMDFDKNYLCAAETFACLPLVGVILRLADILDFDSKRTPSVLYSHLYVRNPVSLAEWNKHRAVESWEISPELIQFNARCTHPAIEASIHEFCNWIDHELTLCNNIVTALNEFNSKRGREISVKFPFKVDREKIQTKKDIHNEPQYIYRDTQFNLSKRQVIDLLMGTKLYGNPQVALRELLQNSIDACLLRAAQEEKWGNNYEPEISVKYYVDGDSTVLEVTDNGTGMDQYIIDNYYSKVGSSFYKSTDFYNLKSESNADFTPTSRFGIGILSCFMVADTLIVNTKRVKASHSYSDALNMTVEGQESIFWIRKGTRETPGTTTKLLLRKNKNPWDNLSETEFIKSVETVIPNPPFKINIHTTTSSSIRDENSFKEVTAITLKDYSWREHENIKLIEITLDNKDRGIVGSVTAAVLERHGMPVSEIELKLKQVMIEGEIYNLEKSIKIEVNAIKEKATTISIDENGEIDQSNSTSEYSRSRSRLSLHGIEVPSSLFPDSWSMKHNQVKLSWPFPLILVIDICGTRDLDMNSARTEIIMSEKWLDFEEELAFQVCEQIANSVNDEYWTELKALFITQTKNETFLRGLNKVEKF
ncbi:ATP-binding protein [uncultured Flavobacterium sp.]|uniref:HD domain-containing protein n=1 Tax=uncultured Flavobacterium sp. TaxID=165435 RepID=UPI0025E46A40|nr:ATP-binding protein [uncultured Flavobacterium sp.]